MVKNLIKRILVPLDGSKNSQRGLEMAISLARSTQSTITGVYSIDVTPRTEFMVIKSFEDGYRHEAQEVMDKAKTYCAKNGIDFTSKILRGNTGYNIIKTAQSGKFDLIVIGSRGRGSVKEMFFGSVSNYVIHSSKIPVLVVK